MYADLKHVYLYCKVKTMKIKISHFIALCAHFNTIIRPDKSVNTSQKAHSVKCCINVATMPF